MRPGGAIKDRQLDGLMVYLAGSIMGKAMPVEDREIVSTESMIVCQWAIGIMKFFSTPVLNYPGVQLLSSHCSYPGR